MDPTIQADLAVLHVNPQSLSFTIGSPLECRLDGFTQRDRVSFARLNLKFVSNTGDAESDSLPPIRHLPALLRI